MQSLKCFDIVKMVTDEATNQFAPIYKRDSRKFAVLEQYCAAIDELAEEFDGKFFEVSVEDNTMVVCVTIGCAGLNIESAKHVFLQLVRRAMAVHFSAREELLAVQFIFPSIWEHA